MRIVRATLETCGEENDTAVAVDVLRAFTTAAVAFSQGAPEIILAASVREALTLHEQFPGSLTIGEIDGLPIEGFDFGNSPSALLGVDLSGRRIIQRTTAGTQGVHRSAKARHVLAASLCCASATARQILKLHPESVTFIETGLFPGGWGDEDAACADLIQALVEGSAVDRAVIVQRVRSSKSGQHYADPANDVFPPADLAIALDIDRFDFALVVERENGLPILRPSR
jgi:2-phosphosulfolactate phosphatase